MPPIPHYASLRFGPQHRQVLHARSLYFARAIVALASRGWGKTFVSLQLTAHAALAAAPPDTALWLTPVIDQFRAGWRSLRHAYTRHVDHARATEFRLEFAAAGALEFRSAHEPDHLRGKTYCAVALDEATLVPHDAWLSCIRPTQRKASDWYLLISTPRGRDWVWAEYQKAVTAQVATQVAAATTAAAAAATDSATANRSAPAEASTATTTTASEPAPAMAALRFPALWQDIHGVERCATNIDPARVRAARTEMPEAVFAREYLCEFQESAAVCFKSVADHVLSKNEHAVAIAGLTGPFVIGVDWGFARDYSVACVLDRVTGHIARFWRSRQAGSAAMCREIADLAHSYGGAFCLCDVTSLQDQALGALRTAGAWATGFTFTPESKTNLIERLLMAWESHRVRIPAYRPLLDELKTFEASYTPATRQRTYGAAPGVNNHDDCVIALALAWWANTEYPGEWQLDAAPKPHPAPIDWDWVFAAPTY